MHEIPKRGEADSRPLATLEVAFAAAEAGARFVTPATATLAYLEFVAPTAVEPGSAAGDTPVPSGGEFGDGVASNVPVIAAIDDGHHDQAFAANPRSAERRRGAS